MKKITTTLLFSLLTISSLWAQKDLFGNASLTISGGDKSVAAERHRFVTVKQDLLALPEQVTLGMGFFADTKYKVLLERQPRKHAVGDVDIYWGNSGDPAWAHLAHYHDVVMTVNRTTEKAIIYAMTSDGTFMAMPSSENSSTYRVYEEAEIDWSNKQCGDLSKSLTPETGLEKMMPSGCNEQDASGRHVVDMLFSYSHEAEGAIGDLLAHATAQAETVNMGLANSLVTNVFLRVVDIAVEDNFVGIYSPALEPNLIFYGPQMEAVGADILADYQVPAVGVNNAGGWAFQPGQSSINSATGPTVFRHEWGHNTGSSHCNPGLLPYAAGYDNGNVNTHMCGNNINFYSTPLVNDAMGVPLGDAATADNARAIRERAAVLSGYRQHLIPYDASDTGAACALSVAEGVYYIRNVESGNYLGPESIGNLGEKIFQRASNANQTEMWEVHSLGNGSVMIYNRNFNSGLDVFAGSVAVGHNVGLWRNSISRNYQLWHITQANSGHHIITSLTNGLSLRVPDGMTADGDQVWQDSYDNTSFAEWEFIPVTPDPGLVTLSGTSTNETCTPGGNGTVGVTVTGNAGTPTYEWNDEASSTSATLSGLDAGSYQVTVTVDGRDYFYRKSVRTSPALFAEVSTTRATPTTGGSITITNVLNSTGALNYEWSDGGPNDATRVNPPTGDYAVTITDGSGCEEIRKMRMVKTLEVGDYAIQHVSSGLYAYKEGGQVLLGDCPTDADLYRWTSIDVGGDLLKFRSTNGGGILTVFGRNASGSEYRTGGDGDVTPHMHQMIATGTDTWILRNRLEGFYTSVTSPTVGGILIHVDLADPSTADEWRFVPIVDCTEANSSTCVENPDGPANEINLLCACCGETALPVELISFSGEILPKANQLNWTTRRETDNAGFYLQRSLDGRTFSDLAWIDAIAGNGQQQDYDFLDVSPFVGANYYRLRQVDVDGTMTFSNIITLHREEGEEWTIYPNPVSPAQTLKVSFRKSAGALSLLDINGRLVHSVSTNSDSREVMLELGELPAGVYLLRNERDGGVKRLVIR